MDDPGSNGRRGHTDGFLKYQQRLSGDGLNDPARDVAPFVSDAGAEPGGVTAMPMPMPADVCPLCNGRGCETCRKP